MYRPYEGPGEGLLPLRKNRPSVSSVIVTGGRSEKLYLEAVRTAFKSRPGVKPPQQTNDLCIYSVFIQISEFS